MLNIARVIPVKINIIMNVIFNTCYIKILKEIPSFINATIFLSDFHVKLQYMVFCLLFMAFFTPFNSLSEGA